MKIHRVHELNDGDIIHFHHLLLEYEDKVFYVVKEPIGLINPYFERTGITYTAEELNDLARGVSNEQI